MPLPACCSQPAGLFRRGRGTRSKSRLGPSRAVAKALTFSRSR